MGQNQWYHFGVGAPPILVYFSGDWDVHWGYDLVFDPWPFPSSLAVLSREVKASELIAEATQVLSGQCSAPTPRPARGDTPGRRRMGAGEI